MKKNILILFLSIVIAKNIALDQHHIIQYVNSLKTSWIAGHNQYFEGRTMDEIKLLMGSLETPTHLRLPEKDIIPIQAPEQFHSSQQWPKCQSIKQIRDQSTCGSCWAFGAVQAMSDRICIASNQTIQVRISAEDLLTCCLFGCGDGCNGGYPQGAWIYFKNRGIVTGWLYNTTKYCMPYSMPPCDHHTSGKYEPCGASQPTPSCKKSCVQGYNGTYFTDKWNASSVYTVPSQVQKIQAQIMTYGPVEASFTVYTDFLTYKSGVYYHTSGSSLGGHAVKIVGWGVDAGVPYWHVANSWNEDWGDRGFFKIRRGNNQCGIQSQIVAGIPNINATLRQE